MVSYIIHVDINIEGRSVVFTTLPFSGRTFNLKSRATGMCSLRSTALEGSCLAVWRLRTTPSCYSDVWTRWTNDGTISKQRAWLL